MATTGYPDEDQRSTPAHRNCMHCGRLLMEGDGHRLGSHLATCSPEWKWYDHYEPYESYTAREAV